MPKPDGLTPFQRHVAKWRDCRGCALCERRLRTVIFRGDVPCEVLMIGEAPGKSENSAGVPFWGVSGQLLDQVVARVRTRMRREVRFGFTNVVCCIPLDENWNKVEGGPDDEHIAACSGRLIEIIGICRPKLIVAVGTVSRDAFDRSRRDRVRVPGLEDRSIEFVSIDHPAFILRQNWTNRGPMINRAVVLIKSAIDRANRPRSVLPIVKRDLPRGWGVDSGCPIPPDDDIPF